MKISNLLEKQKSLETLAGKFPDISIHHDVYYSNDFIFVSELVSLNDFELKNYDNTLDLYCFYTDPDTNERVFNMIAYEPFSIGYKISEDDIRCYHHEDRLNEILLTKNAPSELISKIITELQKYTISLPEIEKFLRGRSCKYECEYSEGICIDIELFTDYLYLEDLEEISKILKNKNLYIRRTEKSFEIRPVKP